MAAIIIYLPLLVSVVVAISIPDCPPNLPRDRFLRAHGSSCYSFILSQEREFAEAESECHVRGGHLVTVRNADTQQFLYNTLKNEFHYNGVVWIGLTDSAEEDRFMWMDGSPVTYTHWAEGQPGMVSGLEDCAGLDIADGGRWHDFRCSGILFVSSEHYYVCEFKVST